MLYLENPENTFTVWTGSDIDGVRYPRNIETLWTAAQLAALGLYKPADPGVPDGKVATSSSVQRVDGIVTVVYDLEDVIKPHGKMPSCHPRGLTLGEKRGAMG